MPKKRLGIFIGILLALLAAAGGYYYLSKPSLPGMTPTATMVGAERRYQTALVMQDTAPNTLQTTGTIRSNQTTTLAWQTSGTVLTVNADKGEAVPAKTVLAELDPATLPQAIILAQADLVTAQKNLDTLLSSSQARANAQLALVKTEQALDDATTDRRNKQYQRASPEVIDIARSNLISANDALNKAEDIYNQAKSRNKEDVTYAAALAMYARARQDQIRAQYNLDYVMDLPDPLDIQEADAKVAVAQANVQQAKLDWERVKDGPNQDDVSAAQARVTAAQAALNMAHITAPFAGTITLSNNKAGDQVTAGTVSFQLDDLSHLFVDVAVAELDLPRVKVGQPASLTLAALPGKVYAGTVTDIGMVGKSTAGTVNYTVTLEVTQPGPELKPGMSASAAITTGQPSNAFLVPTGAICAEGDQAVVYLLKNSAPLPVAVQGNGPMDDGGTTTIIRAALQAGDPVITNPPCGQAASGQLPTPIPLPAVAEGASAATSAAGAQPTAVPTQAAEDSAALAVQTVKDYFAALQNNDYETAANSLSTLSLTVDNLTRSDGADELHSELAKGMKWANLEVKDTQAFNDKILLVHVTYDLTSPDPKGGAPVTANMDELWPVTFENGQWLYNRNNLIDFKTLSTPDQSMAGLRVQPVRLTRYSDRVRLTLLVQNTTNESIVLGQANEIMAAFTFKGQAQPVEAEKTQLIFQRLTTYSQTNIDVKGLFATYPDSVAIRQWKNLQVKPWFEFNFSD